jgi:Usg-like family
LNVSFWRIENHATVSVGLEVGMVEKAEVSKDFKKQALGDGLTTVEIVYRRPDRHWLLQTYVWHD